MIDIARLDFTPPCESKTIVLRGAPTSFSPGPMIRLSGQAAADPAGKYSRIRGLEFVPPPTGCASLAPTASALLSPVATLPSCVPGADSIYCGFAAVCSAKAVNAGDMSLTTPTCSCVGLNKPIPSPDYSPELAPFLAAPLGCSTPREGTGVGLAALDVQDVVFDLVKPATDTRTLTLKMGGTAMTSATWSIVPSSVPPWLAVADGYALNGTFGAHTNEVPPAMATAPTTPIATLLASLPLPSPLSRCPHLAPVALTSLPLPSPLSL